MFCPVCRSVPENLITAGEVVETNSHPSSPSELNFDKSQGDAVYSHFAAFVAFFGACARTIEARAAAPTTSHGSTRFCGLSELITCSICQQTAKSSNQWGMFPKP